MKRFFKFLKYSQKLEGTPELKNARDECQHHDITVLKNLKANEFCYSCNLSLCYICGQKHIKNNCDVEWGQDSYKKYNLSPKSQKSRDFNLGYLAKLTLKNLKCVCGKEIENEQSAGICAACGTATCSSECHEKYAVQTNECTFQHNFTAKLENQTLRSILFKNVYLLFDKKFGMGVPVAKTSNYFIQGYLSDKRNEVYLQRGFRIYGNPAEQTLQNLEVYNKVNVDFVNNQSKVCMCKCTICSSRSIHPINGCLPQCKSNEATIKQEVNIGSDYNQICNCQCEFCQSGILIQKHSKILCLFNCHLSGFYGQNNQ